MRSCNPIAECAMRLVIELSVTGIRSGREAPGEALTSRSLSSGHSRWDKLKCQLGLILVQTAYSDGDE